MGGTDAHKPRWLRDLERFLPLKSQFVLSGNIRDLHAISYHGTVAATSLSTAVEKSLREIGYESVIGYDRITGFHTVSSQKSLREADVVFLRELGLNPSGDTAPAGMELLGQTLNRFVTQSARRAALLVDFASRLAVRPDMLSNEEHQLFTQSLLLSHRSVPRPDPEGRPFYNTVLWIVEKEGDLPDWLLVANPMIRHIPVAKPDHLARRAIAPSLLQSIPGATSLSDEHRTEVLAAFVEETEGLLLKDLMAIAQLARTEGVEAREVGEAVRRYKIGVTEDPWARIDRNKVRLGDELIRRRVRGQDHAITHILDIVKRAITGIGSSRQGRRPRGVVFLAGPTGVGKTELAKSLTELLFGDDNAYIRFDMSEFSAEHADQRLIGAPPGYVGYDAGGELTNAIRERPFSVVLFDEIEKAHPRLLDKFLQILDDGVLTSGRGDRVYFTEAFIVFTSNLGIYRIDPVTGERVPNATEEDDFQAIEARVLEEIRRYFKVVLNRPEILNRIGENIIVFDFIRGPVAGRIFDSMLQTIVGGVADSGVEIELTPSAEAKLKTLCTCDLSNGGRGIRNQLESIFINPLARALFDADVRPGTSFSITEVTADPVPRVLLEPASATGTKEDGDGG
jgi:energy-coupling factor transporter ATP-binding protein EcfA2